MRFEWHAENDRANFAKHGIRFAEAARIFDGPVLTRVDPHSEGELRDISLGLLGPVVVLAVVHTDRAGVTRIISARKATQRERQEFFTALRSTLG